MALPLVTGLNPAPVVTGVAVGGLAVALGIAGTGTQGRGTLPISVQAVYDRGLALGLLALGVLYGALGDQASVLVFGLAGLSILLVTVTTRYSVRPF